MSNGNSKLNSQWIIWVEGRDTWWKEKMLLKFSFWLYTLYNIKYLEMILNIRKVKRICILKLNIKESSIFFVISTFLFDRIRLFHQNWENLLIICMYKVSNHLPNISKYRYIKIDA